MKPGLNLPCSSSFFSMTKHSWPLSKGIFLSVLRSHCRARHAMSLRIVLRQLKTSLPCQRLLFHGTRKSKPKCCLDGPPVAELMYDQRLKLQRARLSNLLRTLILSLSTLLRICHWRPRTPREVKFECGFEEVRHPVQMAIQRHHHTIAHVRCSLIYCHRNSVAFPNRQPSNVLCKKVFTWSESGLCIPGPLEAAFPPPKRKHTLKPTDLFEVNVRFA